MPLLDGHSTVDDSRRFPFFACAFCFCFFGGPYASFSPPGRSCGGAFVGRRLFVRVRHHGRGGGRRDGRDRGHHGHGWHHARHVWSAVAGGAFGRREISVPAAP